MRLEFQKNIASSQFTLPFVSTIAIILWVLLPTAHAGQLDLGQHGLWSMMPRFVTDDSTGKYIAMAFGALGVYLVAELTNSNVLLRISSRMLSSTLALFLGVILCLHSMSPGLVIMLCTVLSFFALFATYQLPHPVPTFVAYLFLSLGSLVFPKLLFLTPIYWGCQAYLRSLSLRCFVASVLGVLVPYWFFIGVECYVDGDISNFLYVCKQLVDLKMPDYSSVHAVDICIFAFVVQFFIFGAINFITNSYLDKTRTRIVYNVIITHAVFVIIFIALQPQFNHTLMPMLLVDSALVGGHFIALTYNRFSHIYCLVCFVLVIALLIAQLTL